MSDIWADTWRTPFCCVSEGPNKVLTGIPLDVRIMATSVSENSRLEDDFAAVNLVSARPGSAADSPRSILMHAREAKVDARRFPATFGLAQSQTLAPELQSDLTRPVFFIIAIFESSICNHLHTLLIMRI